MKKSALKAAFPLTIPVMAGYLVLGFGFGIYLESNGYHFGWALLMSLTIYAGSMQYVAVSLLTGGASLITRTRRTARSIAWRPSPPAPRSGPCAPRRWSG